MSDVSDETEDGNLELFEGDLSIVIRSDGGVEFLIAVEDETSEEYQRLFYLMRYLRFALGNEKCMEIFAKHISKEPDFN
jgi:hypothetical protein